jgi:hypothetical protein
MIAQLCLGITREMPATAFGSLFKELPSEYDDDHECEDDHGHEHESDDEHEHEHECEDEDECKCQYE